MIGRSGEDGTRLTSTNVRIAREVANAGRPPFDPQRTFGERTVMFLN
jgi:hypothetical protein